MHAELFPCNLEEHGDQSAMILAAIFLISGAALALMMPSDDDISDEGSSAEEGLANTDDEADPSPISDERPDLIAAIFERGPVEHTYFETSDSYLIPQDEDGHFEEESDSAVASASPDAAHVDLSDDTLEKLPQLAADWTTEADVTVISAHEGQAVSFNGPDGAAGSLVVMSADYVEQDGGPAGQLSEHTGVNVYFVPDGEKFPEQFEWSRESATLYNTDVYSTDDEASFGTKLLARIDMGSWTYQPQEDGPPETLMDNRIPTPLIASNYSIAYIGIR